MPGPATGNGKPARIQRMQDSHIVPRDGELPDPNIYVEDGPEIGETREEDSIRR